jgi:hypothetical protein
VQSTAISHVNGRGVCPRYVRAMPMTIAITTKPVIMRITFLIVRTVRLMDRNALRIGHQECRTAVAPVWIVAVARVNVVREFARRTWYLPFIVRQPVSQPCNIRAHAAVRSDSLEGRIAGIDQESA